MVRWLVFAHELSALLFMASHGVAISVAFRLRSTRGRDAILTLLAVSRGSLTAMYVAFGAMALSGIALGFAGGWWRTGWWWASVLVLIAIFVAMVPLGVEPFNRIRKYAGVGYAKRGRWYQPETADPAAMEAELTALRPGLLTAIAFGGIAILVWLMLFKPL